MPKKESPNEGAYYVVERNDEGVRCKAGLVNDDAEDDDDFFDPDGYDGSAILFLSDRRAHRYIKDFLPDDEWEVMSAAEWHTKFGGLAPQAQGAPQSPMRMCDHCCERPATRFVQDVLSTGGTPLVITRGVCSAICGRRLVRTIAESEMGEVRTAWEEEERKSTSPNLVGSSRASHLEVR